MSSTSPVDSGSVPTSTPQLQISTHIEGDTTELHLAGELDLANVNELRQQIRWTLDRHDPHMLLLDLSRLAFADSTGLAAMVWAHNQLIARNRQLRLRHPSAQVSQVLRITGLDRHLPIIPAPQQPQRSD